MAQAVRPVGSLMVEHTDKVFRAERVAALQRSVTGNQELGFVLKDEVSPWGSIIGCPGVQIMSEQPMAYSEDPLPALDAQEFLMPEKKVRKQSTKADKELAKMRADLEAVWGNDGAKELLLWVKEHEVICPLVDPKPRPKSLDSDDDRENILHKRLFSEFEVPYLEQSSSYEEAPIVFDEEQIEDSDCEIVEVKQSVLKP